ncbi:metallophosphoesterase [Alicyclobacillus mengziensis]|uniref:Metallophosphoesterase n=1 Tax=Alicyclobacillus mengziensis TaxID=2931921 RepID=A0A9X7VV69_9BACL|nr:metallophosphoesterase [Alicyclobacillus mengziensis]QSO45756.1 metallophosphoesterase [Alicyclobacillus mengziensis]
MIYAIGDLHLSNSVEKPMDVFGEAWTNHQARIEQNWNQRVSPDDIVLIPGDISWAMTLDEAILDLKFVSGLPGTKVMIRGNHDYWWSGISKVRAQLEDKLFAIQNDSFVAGNFVICGIRGWLLPGHPQFTTDDMRLLQREAERLRLSLDHADKTGLRKICMIHYPPIGQNGEPTVFSELLETYDVKVCVYGHLHGHTHRFAFEGVKNDVRYQLTSADYIDFDPVEVRV